MSRSDSSVPSGRVLILDQGVAKCILVLFSIIQGNLGFLECASTRVSVAMTLPIFLIDVQGKRYIYLAEVMASAADVFYYPECACAYAARGV